MQRIKQISANIFTSREKFIRGDVSDDQRKLLFELKSSQRNKNSNDKSKDP